MEHKNDGAFTGFKSLNKYYKVRSGELTVLTGISNVDTRSFLDPILISLARKNWKLGIFSNNEEVLLLPSLKKTTKKDCKCKDSECKDSEELSSKEMDRELSWHRKHFFSLYPPDNKFSFDLIVEHARRMVMREGIKGFMIDSWEKIYDQKPKDLSGSDFIFKCINELRQFAMMYSLHIFIISNPTNLLMDETGNFPVTTPYDIHTSGMFETKVQNCLALFRGLGSDDADIHIQKSGLLSERCGG